jgi:hypothetical protein
MKQLTKGSFAQSVIEGDGKTVRREEILLPCSRLPVSSANSTHFLSFSIKKEEPSRLLLNI